MHLAFHLDREKRMKIKVQGIIGNQNTWRLDKKAKSITGTEHEESTLSGKDNQTLKSS